MKEDFVTVHMNVSRMKLDIRTDVFNHFFAECIIYGIRAAKMPEKVTEKIVEDNDFGTDLELLSEREELANTEDLSKSEAKRKNGEKELSYWQKWQKTITRCIIALRQEGGEVSRITRMTPDRHKEVVLLIQGVPDARIRDIFSEYSASCEIPFLFDRVKDPLSLRNHEIVNLLFGLLPYRYARIPADQYPYGGYQVFMKTAEGKKKPDRPEKSSFGTIYLDADGLLKCALKPYYKDGSWIQALSETHQWESEANRVYRIAPTGQDDFLTRGCETDGDYTDEYYLSEYLDRGLVRARVAHGNGQEETKQIAMDRAIFRFNETFGHLITIKPECWEAKKHWSEVTNTEKDPVTGLSRSGAKQVDEGQMEAVNFVRTAIEEAGGFAIVSSEYVKGQQDELAEAVSLEIESFYKYAVYQMKKKSVRKHATQTEWVIPAMQEDEDGPYTIAKVSATCKRSEQATVTVIAIAKDGQINLKLPTGTAEAALEIFVQKPYDSPLHADSLIHMLVRDNSGAEDTEANLSISYRRGFGVEDGTVYRTQQAEDALSICLLPDNTTKKYKGKERLSVQHFGLIDMKSAKRLKLTDGVLQADNGFLSKCQKTMYELAIRQALLDGEIPVRGHMEVALYAFYVPSKRRGYGRTRAHYRYFFYDGAGICELRWDDLKDYTRYFPRLFEFLRPGEPRTREHRYFIKTSNDTYYLWRTDMTALGNTEIDENGAVKALPSKSVDSLVLEVPGGFGVTFYHEMKDLEDVIYYCSAGFRHPKDIQSGWQNAAHIYEVHHDRQDQEPDYHDLREMLTDPLIKLNQYTVRPSIFKYLDESQKCSGRR